MRILIADDDPTALEGMQRLLAKWGHEVAAARDGQEAECLLRADDAPAVAILDWVMPKRSGVDVCVSLRARGGGSPYVILVTSRHKKDILAAFEAGVDDFIAKPVDPVELRARLQAAERIVTLQARLQDRAEAAEDRYRLLYATMNEGMALHEVIYDEADRALDYRILDVNPAYTTHTGIERQAAIGRRASQVYRAEPPPYLATYARVVESGKPEFFEIHFAPMGRHFRISAFRVGKGQFGTVFTDITGLKHAEEAIKSQLEELQRWQDIMLGREDRVGELRREVDDLCCRLGEPLRYPSQEAGLTDSDTVNQTHEYERQRNHPGGRRRIQVAGDA